MSNIPNYNPSNVSTNLRPEHHIHDSSEPLPGAAGGRSAADYSADNVNTGINPSRLAGDQPQDRLAEFGNSTPETNRPRQGDRPVQVNFEDQTKGYDPAANNTAASAGGRGELFSDRPPGVKQQGVNVGGRENDTSPTTARAGMGDKMVGKTQKVMGKMMNNPDMHEKGELRETVGKPAVSGSAAGAPHG